MIQPLFGHKFSLDPHIKFVNLLADYSNLVFINAEIDMLSQLDFPNLIYWNNGFSPIANVSHIYSNSYYRKFHIQYDRETIVIDADTLTVSKLTAINKLKLVHFSPKTGIQSISFNKTYPLLNSTKGLKIGFGNYLLTFIVDINTDDRHHLELINVKQIDTTNVCGAFISKDKIIKISNLEGKEI